MMNDSELAEMDRLHDRVVAAEAEAARLRGIIGNARAGAESAHESSANLATKLRLSLVIRELEKGAPR